MKRVTLLAFILLVFAMSAFSQAEGDCDAVSLRTAIQAQLNEIDDDPLSVLSEIIRLALGGLFECVDDSWYFGGHPGAQPVKGPLALHEGYYIFTLTTDGSAKVEAKSLNDCGKDMNGTLFSISAGQAIYGAEILVQTEVDCTVYLELSKISASWTLEISKLP